MGQNFAKQLIEVRDGDGESAGIGKIALTEHSENTISLLGGNPDIIVNTAIWTEFYYNQQHHNIISFPDNSLYVDSKNQNTLQIDHDGNIHHDSLIETFLHELSHVINSEYLKLERKPSVYHVKFLNEFDAISFANAALDAIDDARGNEREPRRSPVAYGLEKRIATGEFDGYATIQDCETAAGIRILAERGMQEELKEIVENNTEQQPATIPAFNNKTIINQAISEQPDTTLKGESIKLVSKVTEPQIASPYI